MKAVIKFWQRGAEDADRRIAAILSAPPADVADRYLRSSIAVRSFDRVTTFLRTSLTNSQAGRGAFAAHEEWRRTDWPERYQTIALVLIIAVAVHVAAVVSLGQQPGWFWLIVPGLTFVFAVLLLIASRSTPATHSPK